MTISGNDWMKHPSVRAAKEYLRRVFGAPDVGFRRWYGVDDAGQDAALKLLEQFATGRECTHPVRQGQAVVIEIARRQMGRQRECNGKRRSTRPQWLSFEAPNVMADVLDVECQQSGPESLAIRNQRLGLLAALPDEDQQVMEGMIFGRTLTQIGASLKRPICGSAVLLRSRRISRQLQANEQSRSSAQAKEF